MMVKAAVGKPAVETRVMEGSTVECGVMETTDVKSAAVDGTAVKRGVIETSTVHGGAAEAGGTNTAATHSTAMKAPTAESAGMTTATMTAATATMTAATATAANLDDIVTRGFGPAVMSKLTHGGSTAAWVGRFSQVRPNCFVASASQA